MRAIAGILATLTGVGMTLLGLYLALGEGLCEGQEPGGCQDYPNGVIGVLFVGGVVLAFIGVAVAVYAVLERFKRRRQSS